MARWLLSALLVSTFGVGRAPAQSRNKTAPSARPDPLVEGSGPPLVMLGGGIRGAAEFEPHASLLARNFRVIRIQTLNIASAEAGVPLPRGYSVKTESRALREALDRLGVSTKLNLVGHSFGALVALDFALDHQDRVRSLTIAEPPAFWVVPRSELQATPDMRAMFELSLALKPTIEPSDEQPVSFLCRLGNCGQRPPDPMDTNARDWAFRRSALRGLSVVATHTDKIDRVRAFRRPVLIVTGKDTVSFHQRIDDILAAEFPAAEQLRLPGGHGAVASDTEEFVRGLMAFLNRHP
jgi:pimeloyl-ACP methyl ester carboxylesterase